MLHRTLLAVAIAFATIGTAHAGAVPGIRPPDDRVGVDADGKEVLVSAYRGKVVVLSFWASWCGYCLKELPVLEKIQRVLGKDRIEVIAINIDKDRADYFSMKRRMKNFEFTMARDEDEKSADEYGADGLPFLVMVDKTGRVAYVWKGYPEKKLAEIVKEINGLLDESAAGS